MFNMFMHQETKNLNIQEYVELKKYTSMYVGGPARYFVDIFSIDDLRNALTFSKQKNLNVFILGGGSNVVISDKGFDGLVIKICIKGKNKISESEDSIDFEVAAGEDWDEFVKDSVIRGLYGLENLSHIPGTVGASVVQNIGAYGQEAANSVVLIKVLEIESLREKVLIKKDIKFSYRKSILNTTEKGKYIVLSVVFRLKKKGNLNIKYDDIKKYFEYHSQKVLNLHTLREAIIDVRNKKFPFPDSPTHGTAGSFWNADVIDEDTYENIIKRLDQMGFSDKARYMVDKKSTFIVPQGLKVPYGILIEVLGFKGRVSGGVKILESHSGVINNFSGEGTAKDILCLSSKVIEKIKETFGVSLRVEPELVGEF